MQYTPKFLVAALLTLALAAPVALAASRASVTTTPSRASVGKQIQMLVKGMKPSERIKAVEKLPFGQSRTLHYRAGHTGALLLKVRAQVKGKHVWTFTGRSSRRVAKTSYYVK